ncbi:MAG: protein DpdG [Streptosporangiaceae bacterium]
MALINVGASFPSYLWATVRFLLSADGQYPADQARELLCPATLMPNDTTTFSDAVNTLKDLALITVDDGELRLSSAARGLSPDDAAGFSDLLRHAVLDQAQNAGLDGGGDQAVTKDAGAKDLVRALAWFLTLDAFTPFGFEDVIQLQESAFPPRLGNPIVNDVRWGFFLYWAPALGLAAQSLLDRDLGRRLVPDCTVAVRRTVLAVWEKGERIDAADVIDRIINELPVLPGGLYSQMLGLPVPATDVASSLSSALLRGDHDWISLEQRADAARDVFLTDPDAASGRRRVSEITITGSLDD